MNREELNRNFILLNVGYAYHNADWNWKNVHSPFARIHYVKSGKAKIVREDGIYELKKDHLYLTPSYVRHAYECNEILELYYIHIYEETGKSLSLFDLYAFPVEIEADPLDILLIERLIKINSDKELQYFDPKSYDNSDTLMKNMSVHQKNHLAFEIETQGIIKQLLSRFLLHGEYKNEHIEQRILKSLHYIHKNIDQPIDIDELADMCFLSKDHFIRLFRKEMNCTPGKYINQKKIEAVQMRILIDDASIKDIAYDAGFDNISYFNRLFTKITGERPGQYKKRMKLF